MMNETSFKALLSQLTAIGFPPSVERELRFNAFFDPKNFSISFHVTKGGDAFAAVAYISMHEQAFVLTHYDVTLRRYTDIPHGEISGVVVSQLEEQMAAISWAGLLKAAPAGNEWSAEAIEVLQHVISDLNTLGKGKEGEAIANQLKLRYWEGTVLETYIDGLATLKSTIEIAQRYHCFKDEEPIRLEEAFRFLAHRWAERRLREKRHQNKAGKVERVEQVEKRADRKSGSRQRRKS